MKCFLTPRKALLSALPCLFLSGCFGFGSDPVHPPDAGGDPSETVDSDAEIDAADTDADVGEVVPGCGNGVVEEGEDCDDGNDVDGDGCDSDCSFSCEVDSDCRDAALCNGEEICNTLTHICEPGIPLEEGFVCLSDPRMICLDGACLESTCGDGFVDTGAGETCEPPSEGTCDESCMGYCESDEQCSDDGNACNGEEYCNTAGGRCDHRDALPDGTECGTLPRRICLSRTCQISLCGDGFVDGPRGEECEDGNDVNGDGCDNNCLFSCHDDSECADALPCTADDCDAESHVCEHTPSPSGTLCRPSAGECDVEEVCDGTSEACPSDAFEPDTVLCRAAEDVCDVEETCSGSAALCPADGYAPSGTTCDDGEYCTSGDTCNGFGLCSGDESDYLIGITAICTGSYHTCALLETGAIKCWGLNNHGQLGDGTTINKIRPANVSGLPDAAASIDCGAYHTCALLTSSELACWGWNVSGQVGDGTTVDRNRPVVITALSDTTAAVSAGGYHTCILTQTGGARCWGQNSYGQLGNNTTTDSLTPVQVQNLSDATRIAVGGYHSCAVEGNDVYCWGHNAYGQIGDGTLLNRSVPRRVDGTSAGSIDDLSAGHSHTCAVTGGGRLECWGFNEDGQLGDGTTTNRSNPVLVSGMASGVTDAAAGYYHTCAVMGSGSKCWGRNNHGQLGDGTTFNSLSPVSVLALGGTSSAMEVGYYHSCALLASDQMKCWGQNNQGQIGDGSMGDSISPASVVCN